MDRLLNSPPVHFVMTLSVFLVDSEVTCVGPNKPDDTSNFKGA